MRSERNSFKMVELCLIKTQGRSERIDREFMRIAGP